MAKNESRTDTEPVTEEPVVSWRELAVTRSLGSARTRAENRVQRYLDAALELLAGAHAHLGEAVLVDAAARAHVQSASFAPRGELFRGRSGGNPPGVLTPTLKEFDGAT